MHITILKSNSLLEEAAKVLTPAAGHRKYQFQRVRTSCLVYRHIFPHNYFWAIFSLYEPLVYLMISLKVIKLMVF